MRLGGSTGAADSNAVHAQGRLAHTDRYALAVLATGSDAGVKRHIITDHADTVKVGRPISDQHGALHRCADLAVLDLVGLGALKDVFAGSDIDLTATEAHRVDTIFHRRDDFVGIAVTGKHVGVGHARHRYVPITLAPAVAGRAHVHQSRVLPNLHIADHDAVLDQDRAVGRRALIGD